MTENQTAMSNKALLKSIKSTSEDHTAAIGEQLVQASENAILALVGDLGAGKTHLARALCLKAGVPLDQIQSPTFTLINHYRSQIPVVHMDTYRLSEDEFLALGIDEIFQSPGIKIVEWAERIEEAIPSQALWVVLEHESPNERMIHFRSDDPQWKSLVDKIQ